MRRYGATLLLAMSFAAACSAAPPEVPPKVEGKVGKPVLFDVKIDKGKEIGWSRGFDMNACVVVRLHSDDPTVMSFMGLPSESGDFYLTFWTIGAGEKGHSQTVLKIDGVKPDDVIPTPKPKPDDPPTPAPTGFRVIWVWETSRGLTQGQLNAAYAPDVVRYLNDKAAKHDGHPGWRRWDPDIDATNEKDANLRGLWASVHEQLAKEKATLPTPCVIIAVGGEAKILTFPNSVEESLALLKKYGGP